tara:strand:+ start:5408 stop:6061 length:654 start_codon:yes stop_codon:yes gene_type:complete
MDKGLVGGYAGGGAATTHNPSNRNCLFVIQSGSMEERGRTELLARLLKKVWDMDGAESADVYANNDGRIHYLGNIKNEHPYGHDLWSIPYGGGEGWTNTKTLAGFIETYNHTFIFDDSDSMPELLQSLSKIVDESKIHDYTGILIKNGRENKKLMSSMERAEEAGLLDEWQLAPFVPDPYSNWNTIGMQILEKKMAWLAQRDERIEEWFDRDRFFRD